MTLSDWVVNTRQNMRENGLDGLSESLYEFYVGAWRRAGQVYNYGEPIYERNWDVLIVLDACRADLMARVVDDYEFLNDSVMQSVGSTSGEWMQKNFCSSAYREEVQETAYVTGNPFSDKEFFRNECQGCGASAERQEMVCQACGSEDSLNRVPEHNFQILDEVWRYGWDEELGTIPPGPLTDQAITTWQNKSPNRMVVHYMQPHHPFVPSEIQTKLNPESFGKDGDGSVWDKLRRGQVNRSAVWTDYQSNLEYVLSDVELLLENITAGRVAITADHGNSIGERGLYGHYRSVPLQSQKLVPWCITSAENTSDYNPNVDQSARTDESDVRDRLEALGYR